MTVRKPNQNIEAVRENLHRYWVSSEAMNRWIDGVPELGIKGSRQCWDYYEGRQWTRDQIAELAEKGRPALTLNKSASRVRMALGFQRLNRSDIQIKPTSDRESSAEVADALTVAIKEVGQANQLWWQKADMVQEGLIGGRGYLDLRVDFQRNPQGAIRIKNSSSFSVFPDPDATSYDPEDWADVTKSYWMSAKKIRVAYGKWAEDLLQQTTDMTAPFEFGVDTGTVEAERPVMTFALDEYVSDRHATYRTNGTYDSPFLDHVDRNRRRIRVLERQHREPRNRYVINDMISGAQVVLGWTDKVAKKKAEAMLGRAQETTGRPLELVNETRTAVRLTISAADILLYDDWSPYRSFTIVPYFPYFHEGVTRGMMHDLLDPQTELNVARSLGIVHLSSNAQSGWLVERGSVDPDGMEHLKTRGALHGLVLEWDSRDQTLNAPQEITGKPYPPGMADREQLASDDLQAISGINDEAMGQVDKVQSGRAIEARQRQAVVGIEVYLDNLKRTNWMLGRKILELMQDFYTEERFVVAEGDRPGQEEEVTLNEMIEVEQPDLGERVRYVLNDISQGEYDVVIDDSPASASYMEGQFQEMLEMLREGIPIPPDEVIEQSSLNQKDRIIEKVNAQMGAMGAGAPPAPDAMAQLEVGAAPPPGMSMPMPGGGAAPVSNADVATAGFGPPGLQGEMPPSVPMASLPPGLPI